MDVKMPVLRRGGWEEEEDWLVIQLLLSLPHKQQSLGLYKTLSPPVLNDVWLY